MLGYLQGTTTTTGLAVRAALHDGAYQTGESVPDAEMATLNLTRHDVCPTWNYTLRPRIPTHPHASRPGRRRAESGTCSLTTP
jgi:Rhodopirellula transposase DDE domain